MGRGEMVEMSKKIGAKGIVGIIAGVVVLFVIAAVVLILVLRVDGVEAQNIALQHTGGGEIVQQEVSSEGLWNEYQYTIVNGNQWYEIEVGGFGQVEGLESGSGDSWRY